MPRRFARSARGVSLVELLVGMILSLMVLGIALQLTLIARARYLRLADEALIEERGTQALALIARAVRQAGWITDTPASSPMRRWPDAGAPPSLIGADDCSDPDIQPTFGCGRTKTHTSDALLVRFAGRSTHANGLDADGAMRDCSGYGVPERIEGDNDPRPGRMLWFVAPNSTDKEPELKCKSLRRSDPSKDGSAQGMVRGVETFQLLYTLAATASASSTTRSARAMDKEDWPRVQQVHVAIVVRGDRLAARMPASNTIALFPGLSVDADQQDLSFAPTDPRRNRTRFTATLAVRNPLRCEADAC